jgi:hypothetical protein
MEPLSRRACLRTLSLGLVLCLTWPISISASDGLVSLDIDGDGQALPLTDGILLLRGLFGFQGDALVVDAVAENARYKTSEEIEVRIEALRSYIDVDADGRVSGLTDGLMIIRSLFGFEGEDLIKGTISQSSERDTAAAISEFIGELEDGYYLERELIRLPQPDLSRLSYGSATAYLMEPRGFSEDGSLLLVRTTYLDDGESTVSLRYSMDIWSVNDEEYVSNVAIDAFGLESSREYDVREAVIVGNSTSYSILAKVRNKSDGSERLVQLKNRDLYSSDLLSGFLGFNTETNVERFILSEDTRFLAIQTSDSIYASDINPDTNDTSDIYLLDSLSGLIFRVCELAGAETYSPCVLTDLVNVGDQIRVAFVSTSAFVSPSRIDINSSDISSSELDRADLYVWEANIDSSINPSTNFTLISKDSEGFASGKIDVQDQVAIVQQKIFFNSSSAQIDLTDSNNQTDGFFYWNDQVSKIINNTDLELEDGGVFVGSDQISRFVLLLSSSSEVVSNQTQQLLRLDLEEGSYLIVSSNPFLSDGWVINGSLSPDGGRVAFTADASNLVAGPMVTVSGDLYVKLYF